jgi:hypothetical protein
MFARKVNIRIKPDSLQDFTVLLEREILPLLRKQPGFRDEITLVNENGTELTALSLWENRSASETYDTAVYHSVLESLGKYLDGRPQVTVMRVINSTAHKLAATPAAVTAA